jgi:hypothetical protein
VMGCSQLASLCPDSRRRIRGFGLGSARADCEGGSKIPSHFCEPVILPARFLRIRGNPPRLMISAQAHFMTHYPGRPETSLTRFDLDGNSAFCRRACLQ